MDDNTKLSLVNLLGDIKFIPFFDGFSSNYLTVDEPNNLSNYHTVTISGVAKDQSKAIEDYKIMVDSTNLWNYNSESSSADLAYYSLKNVKTSYLQFYFDETTFVIQAGVLNPIPTDWSDEQKGLMDKYLGQGIYIPFYYIASSHLEGTESPKVLYYRSLTESEDAVLEYKGYVDTIKDYVLNESDPTSNEYNYKKEIDSSKTLYLNIYLFDSLFTVEASVNSKTPVDPTTDDIKGDITLTSNDFYNSTAGDYGEDGLVCSGGGMHYTTTSIKKGSEAGESVIQMKKIDSFFENINSLPSLTSVSFTQVSDDPAYKGMISVYAGESKGSLVKITPSEENIFRVNNAKYFKIANKSNFACYFTSIIFDFAEF